MSDDAASVVVEGAQQHQQQQPEHQQGEQQQGEPARENAPTQPRECVGGEVQRAENKLCDDLWDRIDNVLNHVSAGPAKHVQVAKYLVDRADVEDSYVKALNNHNRKLESSEFGTLAEGWGMMKTSVEDISKLHTGLAEWCRTFAGTLQANAKTLRDAVKEIQNENDRVNKELANANDQNNSANKAYEKLCRDCETAIFTRDKSLDPRSPPTNFVKLAENSIAAYLKAQEANRKYHSTADFLLGVHKKNDDTKRAKLEELQCLEEVRFSEAKNVLYEFGRQQKSMAAQTVQILEDLENNLSVVNVSTDFKNFAQANGSGEQFKEHVTYIPHLAEERIEWDHFNPMEPNLKCGIVEKQGKGLLKKWQPRYFVVKDGFLFYFKAEADAPSLEVLRSCSLQGAVCLREMVHEEAKDLHAKSQFYFKAYPQATPKDVKVYRVGSAEEMQQWISALNQAGKYVPVSNVNTALPAAQKEVAESEGDNNEGGVVREEGDNAVLAAQDATLTSPPPEAEGKLVLWDACGNYRSYIDENGVCWTASGGGKLGHINTTSNEASNGANELLGRACQDVNADTLVLEDANKEVVGTIDLGLGLTKNPSGTTLFELTSAGEIRSAESSLLGRFDAFTFHELKVVSLYLMFLDSGLVM